MFLIELSFPCPRKGFQRASMLWSNTKLFAAGSCAMRTWWGALHCEASRRRIPRCHRNCVQISRLYLAWLLKVFPQQPQRGIKTEKNAKKSDWKKREQETIIFVRPDIVFVSGGLANLMPAVLCTLCRRKRRTRTQSFTISKHITSAKTN